VVVVTTYYEDGILAGRGMDRMTAAAQLIDWLPSVPRVYGRLVADPTAQVLDVGCGPGWCAVALGAAFPGVVVDGVDTDHAAVAEAERNAAAAGLSGRVSFAVHDPAVPLGRYDAIFVFGTLSGVPDPVVVLKAFHGQLTSGGTVVVLDHGAIMPPDTLRGHAAAAGFSAVEMAPADNEFLRFYQLIP
jgi:trans-aconitate methyltransferase